MYSTLTLLGTEPHRTAHNHRIVYATALYGVYAIQKRQSGHYTQIRYTEVGRRAVHFYGYHASQFSRRIRNFKPEINHGVWVLAHPTP